MKKKHAQVLGEFLELAVKKRNVNKKKVRIFFINSLTNYLICFYFFPITIVLSFNNRIRISYFLLSIL